MYPNFALLFLLNEQRNILLLRRINTLFCNGCYSLPGGEIQPGETARQALVREARHSVNLFIDPDSLQCMHIMHRKCNELEFFAIVFQPDKLNLAPFHNNEPERHDQMDWYKLGVLPVPMVPAHKQAILLIQQGYLYSEHGWGG